jgi:hypothetical protein
LGIKTFEKISEVTAELRNIGILVWADIDDLNKYTAGQAVSTVTGVGSQEYLLDTDDEDVVSFRFTPNI